MRKHKKIKRVVSGVVSVIGFILLAGAAGASDTNSISPFMAGVYAGVGCVSLAIGTAPLWGCDNGR